jgi:hypothetical protein
MFSSVRSKLWVCDRLRHPVPKPYLRCHSVILVGVVIGACVWEALEGER